MKTQSKKKDVLVTLYCKKRRIQKQPSRGVPICLKETLITRTSHAIFSMKKVTWMNGKISSNITFCLYFLKEILLAHFQSYFGGSNPVVY